MEEAVCTCCDCLIAIYSSRTDDADRRLRCLHHTGLHRTGVATKKDVLSNIVWILLYEECVLHVAGWMVGGEIHLREHMQVVFCLWSISKHKSHTRENVDDLVLDDGQRMACSELYRIGSPCQVESLVAVFACFDGITQGIESFECCLLELIDFHSHLFLLVGRYIPKICHYGIDLTFLAEIFQAQCLYLLSIRGCHFFYLCKEAFNLVKYHIQILFFL